LIENYIPGRELAVSLLEGPKGLEVLPPVEWRVDGSGTGMLSEAFKLVEPVTDRSEAQRADLPSPMGEELNGLSCRAFQLLGLRDYARFDVRLSPGGTFFFLEANTTPSLEPFEAMALSAQWAGLAYPALVERMLTAALRRYQDRSPDRIKRALIDLPFGSLELQIPEGVHTPPPSTLEMAKLLDVRPGEDLLELGCGTGVLSIAAAKLGARRVVAIDIDPKALESTLLNSRQNGVADRIQVRAGSWYDPLDDGGGHSFDVIVATPPQTPGPRPFGPRYGGFDGTRHLWAIVDRASAFLRPGGRLWLVSISLANPSSLLASLRQRFSSVSIVAETERPFMPEEYNSYAEGLFQHFVSL
jgi:methylase of polypeptide subunit release factors